MTPERVSYSFYHDTIADLTLDKQEILTSMIVTDTEHVVSMEFNHMCSLVVDYEDHAKTVKTVETIIRDFSEQASARRADALRAMPEEETK